MNKNIDKLFEKTNFKADIDKQKKQDIRNFLIMEAEKLNNKTKKINIFKILSATALAFAFSFAFLNLSNLWFWIENITDPNQKNIEKIAYKKYLWNNKSISVLDKNNVIESKKLLYKARQNKKNFQKMNYLAFSNYDK